MHHTVADRCHVVDLCLIQAHGPHFLPEAAVDFHGDFVHAVEQLLENGAIPLLQGLGQHRVVGVGEGLRDHFPGVLPTHVVLVEQQAHELRDGQHRVGVVQLDAIIFAEVTQIIAVLFDIVGDHCLQRGGHEEVLLPHPQHLAGVGGVVGVEHAAQVHDGFAFDDGVGEPLRVEGIVVEFGQGLSLPQPQRAHIVGAVAGDGHVVGGGAHHHVVEGDDALLVFAAHHEGVAVFPPGVGLFRLEPIIENLFEEAVAVEDAVAGDRIVLGDGGIQEACCQAAQATIAQSCVILGIKHIG